MSAVVGNVLRFALVVAVFAAPIAHSEGLNSNNDAFASDALELAQTTSGDDLLLEEDDSDLLKEDDEDLLKEDDDLLLEGDRGSSQGRRRRASQRQR